MATDPREEVSADLFRRLRAIARRYGGPGEAIEETLVMLWKNPEAAHIRSELCALGAGDARIDYEAFSDGDPEQGGEE